MADTISGSRTTTATLSSVYSQVFGTIDFAGDTDWYKVSLTYGYAYQVWVEGSYYGNGTLSDPYLGIYGSSGTFISGDDDYVNHFDGTVQDSYYRFIPSASGSYFLSAEEWGNDATGTYKITIDRDELDGTTSAATVAVNGTVTGSLGAGYDPSDWYRVSLVANNSYQFDLVGVDGDGSSQGLTLPNPFLRLRDSFGNVLASNEDSGLVLNARISWTATQTGTYYLEATESAYEYIKYWYELIVNGTPVLGSVDLGVPKTGTVDANGDTDLYSISLTAGVTYQFRLDGITLSDPFLEVLDLTKSVVASDNDTGAGLGASIEFTPGVSGTYYLAARSSGHAGTGTYSLVALPSANTTTLFLAAGDGSSEQAGVLRTMADFAEAAYSVQGWENQSRNSSDHAEADAALSALIGQGWTPVSLNVQGLTPVSPSGFVNGMRGGFYANANAAAFVARSGDALVISFRGTNDVFDKFDDVISFAAHYDLLRPLVAAVERYVDDPANGIRQIYVTGHSLGGAMAIKFMEDHGAASYEGVAFAAPGYELFGANDQRMTFLEVNGDPVPDFGTNKGPTVHFETGLPLFEHGMSLYRQITHSLDANSLDRILSLRLMDPEVRIGARMQGGGFVVDGLLSGSNSIYDNGADVLTDPVLVNYDVYYGGRGADVLRGGSQPELLLGGAGSDSIDGSGGNDWLFAGGGSDTLKGGSGVDTVVLDSALSGLLGYAFAADALQLDTIDGSKLLVAVERVEFTDALFALDTFSGDSVWQAAALLWAQFGVAPTMQVLSYWVNEADNAADIRELAEELIDYYAPGESAAALVTHLYSTLAGITPTPQQVAFYTDQIGFARAYATTGDFLASVSALSINTDRMVGIVGSTVELDPSYFAFTI